MKNRTQFCRPTYRAGMKLAAALICLALVGCAHSDGPESRPSKVSLFKKTTDFIEDDYASALAQAKQKGQLLFVDAWAPWCHSCLSMQSFVFPDPALAAEKKNFAWAAIDTEKPGNQSFVEKFSPAVWPTLYIIDPSRETAVLVLPGSATVTELKSFFIEADALYRGQNQSPAAYAALMQADELTRKNQPDAAIASYEQALKVAPTNWSQRARAVDSLISRLASTRQYVACLAVGERELGAIPPGTNECNILETALGCGSELGAKPKTTQKAIIQRLEQRAEKILADEKAPIVPDDRSALFEALVAAQKTRDAKLSQASAARWVDYLTARALAAPSPAARRVFDAHLVSAYIELGEPARAIPLLQQSQTETPDDYNPPARLARIYLLLNRLADAEAAGETARKKVYGPRTIRILELQADILEKKGEREPAYQKIREALQLLPSYTFLANSVAIRERLEKRLAK